MQQIRLAQLSTQSPQTEQFKSIQISSPIDATEFSPVDRKKAIEEKYNDADADRDAMIFP